MHALPRIAVAILLSCSSSLLFASSIYRCTDPSGRITFTTHGCSTEQQQDLQHAFNPSPGNGKPVPLAEDAGRQAGQITAEPQPAKVIVVGEQDDGCGNRVIGRERREAIIKKEIRSGMTRADVESALGKPNRITGSNARSRYLYRDDLGNSRQISFDENGCVTGSR